MSLLLPCPRNAAYLPASHALSLVFSFADFRRPTEWTARSAKLVAGTLILIALLAVVTTGTSPSSRSDAAGTSTLRQPVLLHQTVSSLANLSSTEREWQRSWEALGFQLQLADDERCRATRAARAST